jgi:hypothetical protein
MPVILLQQVLCKVMKLPFSIIEDPGPDELMNQLLKVTCCDDSPQTILVTCKSVERIRPQRSVAIISLDDAAPEDAGCKDTKPGVPRTRESKRRKKMTTGEGRSLVIFP